MQRFVYACMVDLTFRLKFHFDNLNIEIENCMKIDMAVSILYSIMWHGGASKS